MTSPAVEDSPRLAVAVAELWPAQGQWTETDYFKLPETNRLVELSEGEVLVMPPPTFTHQRVLDALHSAIKAFVQQNELGVTAFAPLAVRLWPGKIREPDILYYSEAHRDRIDELVSGPPTLAVEIVSPHTRKTDRHDKFFEYAQAGIAEYWIVDPEARSVEVFVLDNGVYTLLIKAGPEGVATSRVLPGFEVVSDSLFG